MNFRELETELYPFTKEDLLRLPRYHSMNYIKHKDGYAKFITRLPRPVNESGEYPQRQERPENAKTTATVLPVQQLGIRINLGKPSAKSFPFDIGKSGIL